jgi:hypothetical protein
MRYFVTLLQKCLERKTTLKKQEWLVCDAIIK